MVMTAGVKAIHEELKEIKNKMVSKDDIESVLETFEILHNSETMEQIKQSERDIINGKTRKIKSVKDILED